MKRLILLIGLLLPFAVYSQDYTDSIQIVDSDGEILTLNPSSQPKDPAALKATRDYSAEKIEVRKFDEAKWKKIVDSHDYTESEKKKKQQDQSTRPSDSGHGQRPRMKEGNSGDDGYDRDYEDEASTNTNLSWLGPLGQILFYAIIGAIIVMIIVQVVRSTSFKSNPKRTPVAANTADDVHDISELDTENLIQKAHNARDYKLAIRLYFLDLLKTLNENGTITWTKDKTNRDYLSELFSKQYYFTEMRRLTLAYERVWYGEHTPTEQSYGELRSEFQEISQKFKS